MQRARPNRVGHRSCWSPARSFNSAVDYPDVELDFCDLTGFENPAQAVQETGGRDPTHTCMPLSGPLFKFTLFQTSPDEFHLFACCHHIAMDGVGMVLVSRRIAAIYSAIVSRRSCPSGLLSAHYKS